MSTAAYPMVHRALIPEASVTKLCWLIAWLVTVISFVYVALEAAADDGLDQQRVWLVADLTTMLSIIMS